MLIGTLVGVQLVFCCWEETPWPKHLKEENIELEIFLHFLRVTPLSSWWGAWLQAGRRAGGHGIGKVAESYILIFRQQAERDELQSHPQCHTFSKEATPPNPLEQFCWGIRVQTYAPMGALSFQPPQLASHPTCTLVRWELTFLRCRISSLSADAQPPVSQAPFLLLGTSMSFLFRFRHF